MNFVIYSAHLVVRYGSLTKNIKLTALAAQIGLNNKHLE
jgi:hypothetical protein